MLKVDVALLSMILLAHGRMEHSQRGITGRRLKHENADAASRVAISP
jgi:hypothetical protein